VNAPVHTTAAQLRRRRAAVAQRLLAQAPDCVDTLDWQALDAAPEWLGLPDPEFARLRARVGAVMCVASLRLWIDGARLAAARTAVGEAFLKNLLAQPATPMNPLDLAAQPRIDVAGQVHTLLQLAGSSVLLAALPSGLLRRAACAALTPALPSTMAAELARSLIARATALATTEGKTDELSAVAA
jgi:hypothetical protein